MLNLVIKFFKDSKLSDVKTVAYENECGAYGCQNYFNDNYKEQLQTDPDVDAILITWENKNYEFKTR